jgi:hypothetical protein
VTVYCQGDNAYRYAEQEPTEQILTYPKAQQLLDAVTEDMKSGSIGKGYLIQDETYFSENYLVTLQFTFDIGDGNEGDYTIAVSTTAKNTIAALEALGVTDDCPLVTLSDLETGRADEIYNLLITIRLFGV